MFSRPIFFLRHQTTRRFPSTISSFIKPSNRTQVHPPSTTILPRRFLSTEIKTETQPPTEEAAANNRGNSNEKQKSSDGTGNGTISSPSSTDEIISKLKSEVEAKAKEASEFKDKLLRSIAEFRNLQDRTARDMKMAKDFAIQRFAKDLVETVDNIDRALSSVSKDIQTDPSKNKELYDLYQGVKMTENILFSTFEKHGLKKVDPMGEKFDPNIHEAVFQAPVEGKEPGVVFHVQRTGFTLNGRTLRAAQVGVVQAPPSQPSQPPTPPPPSQSNESSNGQAQTNSSQ